MNSNKSDYKTFKAYAREMQPPARPILGRGQEIKAIWASLDRPEVSNVILLGPAGSGKTAIVTEMVRAHPDCEFYEIDLSRMSASTHGNSANEMAARMKDLVDEVTWYQQDSGAEVILFIDEFHQIMQLSPAAAEAIKPLLAKSGQMHIRIIAATTFEEYQEFIQKNEALDERLQRFTVHQPDRKTVISILKSMKEQSAKDAVINPEIYGLIVDYSERYLPAQSQPRKSLLIFDAMLGWYRAYGTKIDRHLLNQVIYESTGININWNVDVEKIADYMNSRVLDQTFAVKMLNKRLQISVADLQDDTRPQASFLFSGPTGVGKTELAKALTVCLFGSENSMIRFDMSEYANKTSVDLFREQLTDRVWQHPYSVILLDEIEKADASVVRLLLQVLDDARLTNRHGREVVFNNAYLIMTTNVGSEIYENIQAYSDEGKDGSMKNYTAVIRESLINAEQFPTELINRIDVVIPFKGLGDDTYERIANLRLMELKDRVKRKHGVELRFDRQVCEYLVHEHLDTNTNAGGGRGLKRRIDLEITSEVARFINHRPDVRMIGVVVVGKLAYKDKRELEGSAHIKVGRYGGIRQGVSA